MDLNQVLQQIERFQKGVPFANLVRACTPGDGVEVIADDQKADYINQFEDARAQGRVPKMVPASGAASRMFKFLHEARAVLQAGGTNDDPEFERFMDQLPKFAFYAELTRRLQQQNLGLEPLNVLNMLLGSEHMNYGNNPKGLLSFHGYEKDEVRTPVEEHIVEAACYARDEAGFARLHFTVSPEHLPGFQGKVAEVRSRYEAEGVKLEISYSTQKKSTDTLSVTPDNQPFRLDDGSLLFRPGGHGALIENLNDLQADLVFIKNIDNVVPDHLRADTVTWKQVLGGFLLWVQDQVHCWLKQWDRGEAVARGEVTEFAARYLGIEVSEPLEDETQDRQYLRSLLNRPIRACGMVRNQGEPGGGPFWVKSLDESVSLQIVESSQIDRDAEGQEQILQGATHFNPVDLVCSVRDYQGNAFHLQDFVDPDTCFISEKSKDGRQLKALELPGLWNGAMAKWNTCFVEVPLITFNPVKTVNDLLRPEHQ